MAFMQSLIASSAGATVSAALSMFARICMAAQAEVIGASVSDRAIKIATMVRRRCRARVLSSVKVS